MKISLKKAIDFHGHLGPYLVLGLLIGELAVKRLKARRHFGIEAKVWGATKKPKSCLIDGIQLSTGCTYGKGNIQKLNGTKIRASFISKDSNKKITISLKKDLIKKLDETKDHKENEKLARKLHKINIDDLFDVIVY